MNDFNMQSTKRRASLVLERRTSLSFISENAYDEPTVAVMQEDEIACSYAPTSSFVDMNMKEYPNNLPPLPQASRRMSLGLSMEDIYDLTGETFDIMAENCTSQELDTIIRHDQQQHPLGLENQMNDSLPKQSVVYRRTSLSFMPINSSDPFNFDMEGDDLNLLDASDLQGLWESEDMLASSSSQIVDPYNPLQDPEFAQRYEMQLEGLVKCMKKSSSTRSKVALIKKDFKKKFSYAKKQQQKLAAMGLNKSQDTRKRLLEMDKTRNPLRKVSYCDVKSSRRRRHSTSASPVPVPSKAFSHIFDPTEFEKQNIRSVSMDVSWTGGYKQYNTTNNGGFLAPEKFMMNRNKFARRRSSLTLQSYQMQFFPDF